MQYRFTTMVQQKLATTATGIDVTGTVTADGLTVSPSGTQQVLATLRANSGAGGGLVVQTDASDDGLIRGYDSSGAVQLQFDTDGGDNYIAKGNVGIGTSSPDHILCLEDAEPTLRIFDAVNTLNQEQTIAFGTEPGDRTHAEIAGINTNTGNAAGALSFKTNAGSSVTERMRLDASGHAIIPAGVTLGTAVGVYAAANTLDDYEEGTWTPAPARLTGGSITTDGTITATGSYTKIGRQVTIVCNIAITGTITQGTSNTSITGIPFLPITSPRQHPSAIGAQSALTNNVNDASGINADYAYNALTTRDDNPWVAGSLHFTCTYFTAA